MRKNGFTIIEVVFVFLLILVVTFFILPRSLESTKHASFISDWSKMYTEMEYIFSIIRAQNEDELQEKIISAQNNDMRTKIVLETVKPYLRIKSGVLNDGYSQVYMNKLKVKKGDEYYIDDFYLTEAGEIVGIKWSARTCDIKQKRCGIMVFDVNGTVAPNTWGEDIFGVNVYENKIEPIGKNKDMEELKSDCSEIGTGLYCSYYYLIGGKFD